MNCRLCREECDPESPYNLYWINPETFRLAWMHNDCYNEAVSALKEQPAKAVQFDDRYDEFLWLCSNTRTE